MAFAFERAWVLFLLPVVVLAVLALAWPARRQRGMALAIPIRLLMLVLVILALAGPVGLEAGADSARQVLLVDRSASVGDAALAAVERELGGLSAPQTLVVQFAAEPQLVNEPDQPWPAAEGAERGTDLESALRFAGQLLGASETAADNEAGPAGSVVLVSDGLATTGEALDAAEHLAASGVRVDVLPVSSLTATVDVGVEAVSMPVAVWARDPFSVTVSLYATTATRAIVSVRRDGYDVTDLQLDLEAGENNVAFTLEAEDAGLSAIEAQVYTSGDERPQNDRAGAIALVRPPPTALIVSHRPDAGQRLQAALFSHFISAEMIEASQLPNDIGELLAYQMVILEDVSAETLSVEQLAALKAYVYAHGRGLIVFGGPSAYTLGGYQDTALEDMLPVKLEPPERTERPPASLLLILDRSDSMRGLKIQLVKEAAMRAVEVMRPQDQIGVLAFNQEPQWSVPLGVLGEELTLRQALDGIGAVQPSGGTNILEPLRVGIEAMQSRPRGQQHIVLLSDGTSATGTPEEFQQLVQAGLASDITISSIAIGTDADTTLMAQIAEWGQGRFRLAVRPADIPRMMVAESQYVSSDMVQRGLIQPQIAMPHPLVSHFDAADFPRLAGHVALLPRPVTEADTVLTTPLGDPLLAAWQYGLGRVVAWTGDAGREWSPGWEEWSELSRFWVQMVRYALPDPSHGPLLAQTQVDGMQVSVTVLAAGEDSRGINLAEAQLRYIAPDESSAKVVLAQTAPGEYAVTFNAPGPGAYRGVASLDKDGQYWEVPVGFVVGYSPEFSPRHENGLANLHQIAALTGGRSLSNAGEAALVRSAALSGRTVQYASWLLLAAVLFWPLEIALRRRWRPWR